MLRLHIRQAVHHRSPQQTVPQSQQDETHPGTPDRPVEGLVACPVHPAKGGYDQKGFCTVDCGVRNQASRIYWIRWCPGPSTGLGCHLRAWWCPPATTPGTLGGGASDAVRALCEWLAEHDVDDTNSSLFQWFMLMPMLTW